ncbi:hypothetical protein [uncultured Microbulbifer sp.]|uniref:hypothetical protein n=1 Tax=uncultured Microbulbifer sp. TaxID=348147 RepID=UPI0025D59CC9|nr:hypothetical protein [uncultured Microbulbifer sp.]
MHLSHFTAQGSLVARLCAGAALLPVYSASAQDQQPGAPEPQVHSVGDMIRYSDFALNFRPRYEHVREVAFPHHATAGTLRSRATWTSAQWRGWEVLLEGENVTYISSEHFNNTENGKTQYPVIADPDYSEMNRAQISYAPEQGLFTLGRQRINLGDQRFFGGVGWRQNEQTYDAVRGIWAFNEKLSADYFYIWNVNRIFGPDGADADLSGPVNALTVDYKVQPNQTLSGFYYSENFHDQEALANVTAGAKFAVKCNSFRWHLRAATQRDVGGNPFDYQANYYNAEIATLPLQQYKFVGLVGTEWLTGNDERAFQTPLATLHKFQGFADKFLVTPVDGIRDYYVGGSFVISGMKIAATVHKFRSDRGGQDYGNELDLVATTAITKNIDLLVKYAGYDADTYSSDTDKFWLQFELKF